MGATRKGKRPGDHKAMWADYPGNKYATLPQRVWESDAWKSCNGLEKALLFEMQIAISMSINHDGHCNGRLQFAHSRIKEVLKVGDRVAARTFRGLVEKGFIEIAEPEVWIQREARKLRITYLADEKHRSATKEFTQWKEGEKIFEVPEHREKTKLRHAQRQSTDCTYNSKQDMHSDSPESAISQQSTSYTGGKSANDMHSNSEFMVSHPTPSYCLHDRFGGSVGDGFYLSETNGWFIRINTQPAMVGGIQ
ncbi:MAG: hypothetical protein HOE44_07995 [Candidatus Marinimicrobia bacterium]|jgi:hypothetical protein|nr:hypothetical protein [Candidatus Neomarinimicrobiota bacterium]MBT5291036.1 hypothetical protein [Thiotrichales bacterium]MBT7828806.1 hypothetical protein [Candidatus Neomarinimicrobiota bacterium]